MACTFARAILSTSSLVVRIVFERFHDLVTRLKERCYVRRQNIKIVMLFVVQKTLFTTAVAERPTEDGRGSTRRGAPGLLLSDQLRPAKRNRLTGQ